MQCLHQINTLIEWTQMAIRAAYISENYAIKPSNIM